MRIVVYMLWSRLEGYAEYLEWDCVTTVVVIRLRVIDGRMVAIDCNMVFFNTAVGW